MIKVHRLNGKAFYINPDLIKFLEKTPDTILTLTSGEKFMIQDSITEVIERIVDYRKRIYQEPSYHKEHSHKDAGEVA